MDPARIAELLEPFLGPKDLRRNTQDLIFNISTYIDLLLRWNARINLTAIRDPEAIVTRHFGESLFAARHLFPNQVPVATGASPVRAERSSAVVSVADVGSGAGFPGLPIKLWAPDVSLTLIESNHRKAAFLGEVTRALALTGVTIQASRAETITGASFDVVTLRAVEHFASSLHIASSLVAPGGRLALLIGSAQLDQARSSLPDFSWLRPEPIPWSRSRVHAIANRP
jgi:16S rRNA (guanine527-N7)-methyltransferase